MKFTVKHIVVIYHEKYLFYCVMII